MYGTPVSVSRGGLNVRGGMVLLGKAESYKRQVLRDAEVVDVYEAFIHHFCLAKLLPGS